jgi:hypothetical protein
MPEDVTLDSAVQTDAGATNFRVTLLHLDWEAAQIIIRLREVSGGSIVTDGKIVSHTYTGDTATTLMRQLNKVDLSSNSLHKRIMSRLQTDGVLGSGTISGTPD